MNLILKFIDIILHLDKYLSVITANYGIWIYAVLFIIIFLETGLVVTPFLPGDSIIFASGALAAIGAMNVMSLLIIFYIAAVLGDTANYYIGKKIGSGVMEKEKVKFINKNYLIKANNYYEKHGAITIVLSRFIPIIRTFAPFVAGITKMNYRSFIKYNLIGGALWVLLFLVGGFALGNLPIVKSNFSIIVIAIIIISVIPAIVTFIKERKEESMGLE
ncbi:MULTISPECIES: DedA family protein [Clostridium]|jgi:membrane-associated protein|uniref:DedA family protein n=1 Tax=Clostridium TaxID=1485 RepID=UPI0018AA6779|nr:MULTISPECIES: DedA family protein [Clostridium]MBS5307363.1 DedA family protein [Clostridium sp.]MBS6500788.1 DedA family protein [Clostridium sp.]MDB1945750.1 DedA family protein [Clostridium tertium]MDB1952825.1 DedA family protein [Clostridium tertium]MDB1970329.1 DedA family protein [Clostridium tertium]